MIIEGYFCQFSIKSCFNVGNHWKHLALLMSTHNFCSYGVIRNSITKKHVTPYLFFCKNEPRHEKTNVLVLTWSDTNQAVQLQKMARGLKFWI